MKYFEKLKELFNIVIKKSNIKFFNKFRKLDESSYFESSYFEAYLHFLHNSVYYNRFSITINKHKIKGKYLNEKVNKWKNYGIFDKMFKLILDDYKKVYK